MNFLKCSGVAAAMVLAATSLAACRSGEDRTARLRAAETLATEINDAREAEGLEPLTPMEPADSAAQSHARDLRRTGRLSHDGSDGSSAADRVSRAGLTWCRVAENVARGQRSAAEVVEGWRDSPGHRRNMLGDFSFVGTGQDGDVWVAVFVKPC